MCLILITKIIVVVLNKNGEYMENTNPIQVLKDRIRSMESFPELQLQKTAFVTDFVNEKKKAFHEIQKFLTLTHKI